jgi:hypothetical protein
LQRLRRLAWRLRSRRRLAAQRLVTAALLLLPAAVGVLQQPAAAVRRLRRLALLLLLLLAVRPAAWQGTLGSLERALMRGCLMWAWVYQEC